MDYIASSTDLTAVADAIRTKGGTSSPLIFPNGFVTAIQNIPTGTPINNQNKTVSPTTSQQQITADGGYTGLGTVTVNAITPTKAAATYYASASDQTISSGQWLTGAQTIKGVTTSNLTAANIKKDVVVQVGDSSDPGRIISVTGTYEGGGGGITGVVMGSFTLAANATTATTITTTTTIGFTPTKFFFYRDTAALTDKYVHQALYENIGTLYLRARSIYSGQNGTLTNSTAVTPWTSSSSGYLYLTGANIQYRASTSYILGAGDYTWIAIQ